ncbi:MAG: hypothetical protein JWQ90_5341 [Hydrocarboniphaga sp.]|uniref:YfiR family protein n=1 Tax=Hydrocarboniphaga sp. TaxID=2033016 RepID=UPI002626E09F|nr:YfiR family protein [Hydrocarboniphaga sp.]MDB5972891.1 hypothetical protein [Hydrocarboniphaga sp.]
MRRTLAPLCRPICRPLWRPICRALIRFGLLLPMPIGAQEPVPEAELKAAFIYNFALFTQWPQPAAASGLSFCIADSSALKAAVLRLAGKPVNDGLVTVKVMAAGDPAPEDCGVWIVEPASPMPPVERRGTLMVSDGGSLDGHVMIVLALDHSHVRFDIDTIAAQRAGLKFSSKLLRLARATQ